MSKLKHWMYATTKEDQIIGMIKHDYTIDQICAFQNTTAHVVETLAEKYELTIKHKMITHPDFSDKKGRLADAEDKPPRDSEQ